MQLPSDPAHPVRRIARSKVNLFLHVTGRRGDGYHVLHSLAAFSDIADGVEVRAQASGIAVAVRGPFAAELSDVAAPDNLVARAARALAAKAGVRAGASITIDKYLPVAAGIGGGSADAAAALWALTELWGLNQTEAELQAIGLGIGADLPVCVASRSSIMTGVGEGVSPAPALPRLPLVLVRPAARLATVAVFQERARMNAPFRAAAELPAQLPDVAEVAAFLRGTHNDLEPAARTLAPAIGAAVAAIAATGALLARMSGSGPTCFGLYESDDRAAQAARIIKAAHADWWVCATAVAASGARA